MAKLQRRIESPSTHKWVTTEPTYQEPGQGKWGHSGLTGDSKKRPPHNSLWLQASPTLSPDYN